MSVKTATYKRLRDLVVSGELRPGARLSELPLAGQLGVSRPTLRESLRSLESLGLAKSDGRSLRVAQLDVSELRSALLMRASLEGLHAELAASRIGRGHVAPSQLRHLQDLAEAARRATRAGEHTRAVVRNRAFHQAIDSLADSPLSAAAVDRLWDRIIVSTERSLLSAERGAVVSNEHRELLTALSAGESDRAAVIASRHVRATLQAAHPD